MNVTSARGLKKNVLKEVAVEAETSDVVAEEDMELEEDETGPASCAVTPILAGGSSATHARKKKVFALIKWINRLVQRINKIVHNIFSQVWMSPNSKLKNKRKSKGFRK